MKRHPLQSVVAVSSLIIIIIHSISIFNIFQFVYSAPENDPTAGLGLLAVPFVIIIGIIPGIVVCIISLIKRYDYLLISLIINSVLCLIALQGFIQHVFMGKYNHVPHELYLKIGFIPILINVILLSYILFIEKYYKK